MAVTNHAEKRRLKPQIDHMKFKLLAVICVAAGLIKLLWAAEPPGDGVIQIDHDKVAAVFTQGGTLLQTNNFKVIASHRAGPGVVEQHELDTDIFYVTEGSATLITGGHASELKAAGPGELRGKEITGGKEHHLVKGDVIVIPNGVPHWFKDTSSQFLYFVVKVAK